MISQLDQKKALIDALNDTPAAAGVSLQTLQGKVLRNQALLDSALGGIRSVANKMSTLHRIRRTLDTYDESGRRMTIESVSENKLEKRA
ncbi:hypothetical protein U5922_016715 [Aquicoccus sp. G2-2]|uniref:hypothetical protein n=1 Tax=Aquicoccus sp. G2-2 TaxID=3092120 RepID=UPI002ADF5559|nr:hypothetical protein [Aquicoccus sp. G2-2]MEA1115028.1 hypothetical protein [Aquicoccus sp. G2-2]